MAERYPRDVAIRVLTRVLSDRQELDQAFAEVVDAAGSLEPGTRAWLQDVCAGTLRWKGRLDQVVDSVALKKKPSGWLRKALLLAAYQLIAQERVVAGAVVSETVDLVRARDGDAPAKFANAALRKISEHATAWKDLALKSGASASDAAAWASLPPWLWERLVDERGLEWAKAYARASLERPTLWVRARRPDWKPEGGEPGPVPGSWKASEGGAIPSREGFAAGEFFVQDISSQSLVNGIAEEVRARLGARAEGARPVALDLCAAPGGKSAGLVWSGFDVIASDRDERRLDLLRQTAARVAPEIRILPSVSADGALPPLDLVWVDAPCTGSGILRRHPDVRWLRREPDVKALAALQRELLRKAWSLVRPGGFLAYSVCSVLRQEGPEALGAAGINGPSIRIWDLAPQDFPHGDGFWATLIQK